MIGTRRGVELCFLLYDRYAARCRTVCFPIMASEDNPYEESSGAGSTDERSVSYYSGSESTPAVPTSEVYRTILVVNPRRQY